MWAFYDSEIPTYAHVCEFMWPHTHACTQKQLGARGRMTWSAHNGSRGINFSHFICLLLCGEQLGWQWHNKPDIVVSSILLWLLKPRARLYIKISKRYMLRYTVYSTEVVLYTAIGCIGSKNVHLWRQIKANKIGVITSNILFGFPWSMVSVGWSY